MFINQNLVKKIKEIVSELDLVFYEVRFTKMDGNDIFEVSIDNKTNDISIDDISDFSKRVSIVLDDYERDMPNNYFFQAISPGIKRRLFTLDNYKQSIDKTITLKYFDGKKMNKLVGTLIKAEPIIIKQENGETIEIEFNSIRSGRWINLDDNN